MKFKTTRKYIREIYGSYILSVGYCDAQFLLRGIDPFAYNAGVYGWNCDYYYTDGICICTGYRPHGRSVDWKTLREYENKASAILHDWNYTYDEQMERVSQLRKEWLMTCFK